MANRRKKLSSAQFTRAIPKLTIREIESYIRGAKRRLTDAQISAIRGRRQHQRNLKADRERARAAVKRYKPLKRDRGQIHFIGTGGSKTPRKKGYVIYVTKTGKKWLLKQQADRPYKAARKRDVELPLRKNLRKKQEAFQRAKLERIGGGRTVLRGHGKLKAPRGQHDFQGLVVDKIAKSLKATIEGQASHRSFLIETNLLLRHSDGSTSATSFAVPIDKADHISIRLGGLRNFVAQKFYAYLARTLQYMGFISAGSAAHIKRVTGKQVTEDVWNQYHSDAGHNVPGWAAPRFEVVKIETIEWRISQAK